MCLTHSVRGAAEDQLKAHIAIFRRMLDMQVAKHVRPPTKRDLGKKLRKIKPVTSTSEVIQEFLSARGMLPSQDLAAGIDRLEDGTMKPTSKFSTVEMYKIKLQNPAHLRALYQMEMRVPKLGWGSAK